MILVIAPCYIHIITKPNVREGQRSTITLTDRARDGIEPQCMFLQRKYKPTLMREQIGRILRVRKDRKKRGKKDMHSNPGGTVVGVVIATAVVTMTVVFSQN